MSGKYLGVLDRIEDQVATILIEDQKQELTIEEKMLSSEITEGDWLIVEIDNGTVNSIKKDYSRTNEMKNDTKNRLNQLKSRSKGSHFKKKR